jgi:ACDE family multidrug resistance protein
VAVLLLASTLAVMAGAMIAPVLQVIREDLGVGGTAAGLIITTHGLTIAVSSPAVGWMIDRWGVRRPLGAGLVLYGLAGGIGLLVTSYPALIASRVAFGLGASAVFTGTTVGLLGLYEGPARDRVMGWRTSATSLGGLVWPLVGGALGSLSWHAPFGVYLVGIPIGLAALTVLPDTAVERGDGGSRGRVVALLREHPALLGFYALMTLGSILLYGLAVFLPQRLDELGIEAPILVSLYQVTSTATMSVVGLGYARLRRRFAQPSLLRAAVLCWALSYLVLGTVSLPALLPVALVLYGAGLAIALPTLTVLIGDTAPASLRGQATALSGTAGFFGQFVSPLILGPLIAATTITTGFLTVAAATAAVLGILLVVRAPTPLPATQGNGT